MSAGKLAGKVALVTGAAGGIGAATTRLFAREGARVAASDLDETRGRALVEELPDGLFLRHDVTDEDAWRETVAAVLGWAGALDVLVNNAGVMPALQPLEDTSLSEWRRVTAVNLDGVFLGLKHGIRAMKGRGGAIVNVSSIMGLVGAPIVGAYGASKGAVRTLTKSAAIECAHFKHRIRVNSVHPGYIDTEMTAGVAAPLGGERALARFARSTPLDRLGRAEDIAAAILYLASDDAAFVTGAELVVDGGYTAR
jgi:3(or 17)beta-hydroxysteroid dehydrogenase